MEDLFQLERSVLYFHFAIDFVHHLYMLFQDNWLRKGDNSNRGTIPKRSIYLHHCLRGIIRLCPHISRYDFIPP